MRHPNAFDFMQNSQRLINVKRVESLNLIIILRVDRFANFLKYSETQSIRGLYVGGKIRWCFDH